MGGGAEFFQLLAGEDVNGDEMDLGVAVLASLGSRHADDLAGAALDDNQIALSEGRALLRGGERGTGAGLSEIVVVLAEENKSEKGCIKPRVARALREVRAQGRAGQSRTEEAGQSRTEQSRAEQRHGWLFCARGIDGRRLLGITHHAYRLAWRGWEIVIQVRGDQPPADAARQWYCVESVLWKTHLLVGHGGRCVRSRYRIKGWRTTRVLDGDAQE